MFSGNDSLLQILTFVWHHKLFDLFLTKFLSLNLNLTSFFFYQVRFQRYSRVHENVTESGKMCFFCQEFKFNLTFLFYFNYKWIILRSCCYSYRMLSEILVLVLLDITDIWNFFQ